jgi:ATP-dependent exoDNAse (exonuclease V) beta subunit
MENNLAVYDRMDLQKHGAVMASAGTGKTYTVQNLILRLLMQKNSQSAQISIV